MPLRTRLIADKAVKLSGIPLFADLEPTLLAELITVGELIKLPQHARLFGNGDTVTCLYVILSGLVKRSTLLADSVEKVLELARPGQPLALSEVFSTATHASTAQATKASQVIAIPIDRLRDAAMHHPTLSLRLVETIARQYHAAEFEVTSHHTLPGVQRVLDYLLHLAGKRRDIAGETTVKLDASKKLISARLDMAPETFSRTLRQLSADGVIAVNGRLIHIQNATLASHASGKPGDDKPRAAPLRYSRAEQQAVRRKQSPAALINLCGRHRMLSQRLATCWYIEARKLATSVPRGALRKFRELFEHNYTQTSARVQSMAPSLQPDLALLGELWRDYRELLAVRPVVAAAAATVFDLSERVLTAADRLTAAATRMADTPEAHCVNIAGRNRMLTARIAKLFLFRDWDVRRTESNRLIADSRDEFDANIAKLAKAGASTPEIAAQLTIDTELWRTLTTIIDATPHFAMQHGHAREVLAASDELLRHLDTTVKLFEHLADKQSAVHSASAAGDTVHSALSQ